MYVIAMNTLSVRRLRTVNWSALAMFALGFWLSSSLLFDCLIIPGLLSAGMMSSSGFAAASYLIFGTFNHLELLCGALVLASALVFNYRQNSNQIKANKNLTLASVLMLIALGYTYFLTPQMSALGMSIDGFSGIDASGSMATMHIVYWLLEATKLLGGTYLLSQFYRGSCSLVD